MTATLMAALGIGWAPWPGELDWTMCHRW